MAKNVVTRRQKNIARLLREKKQNLGEKLRGARKTEKFFRQKKKS